MLNKFNQTLHMRICKNELLDRIQNIDTQDYNLVI